MVRFCLIGTAAAVAAMLSGCDRAPVQSNDAEQARAASLRAGEYEVTIAVDSIRSTDNTVPATKSKVGDPPKIVRTCVPADGSLDPAIFTEAGETCAAMDNYMRRGRMNLQYKCTRAGQGQLTQMADGDFKADSFTAKVSTATYFSGSGDYELARSYTARRVGDCPPAAAANQ